MSEKTGVKFCHECGARIPPDSNFCEQCGTKRREAPSVAPQPEATVIPAPPQVPASASKPRKIPIKTTIAAIVVVCVIVVALLVPWVTIVKSKVVQEEFTYSYTYPVSEKRETPHRETVLSGETVTLKAWKSLTQEDYYWVSNDFHLEEGWKVQVAFVTDSSTWISISVKDGEGWAGDTYYSSDSPSGWFRAPKSGDFHVILANYDSDKAHTASVELTTEWTEVKYEQHEQSVTKTATFDVTRYDVVYVSPIDLLLHRI